MSLTELMSSAGLTLYPIVALVFFLLAFGLVLGKTLSRQGSREMGEHARLPLREDEPVGVSQREDRSEAAKTAGREGGLR